MQAVDTFEAALKRLTEAGVELVKFDMGLLSAEGAEVEAELLLAYEAPREISRCTFRAHKCYPCYALLHAYKAATYVCLYSVLACTL